MNKTAIKNFAIWARNKLIADITYKAGLLGISEKGIKSPLSQSTSGVQFFDIGTKEPYSISGIEIGQREALVTVIRIKEKQSDYVTAYKSVVEEVAYTWFNRLIAVRFMEVNDYLPSHIRVLSSESAGKDEPDLVTNPFGTDLEFTPYEKDRIMQLKQDNKLDELFRMLFIKQCNTLNAILPNLFEQTSDYTELLFNITFTYKDGVVYRLVHDIPEDDFNVSKEGQVEIIGWLYQYYNTEPKDETFALLKKNVKITKERIPAATQLFTPDWIVRYMVENSLGRLWLESHPNSTLRDCWKYYLDEAEQTPEVVERLRVLRTENAVKSPEDIKVIDPCMGSGHILVYAFDVLMQIYTSEGYSDRDAAKLILEKNLYGLEIDRRAYQLAYFALMMKSRQYNRRILMLGVRPQVYEPTGYADGMEYGSLVYVDKLEPLPEPPKDPLTLFDDSYATELNTWNFRRLLAQKYDVVITNPPYMGSGNMGEKLLGFAKDVYPDTSSDLSTIMMERSQNMVKKNGYVSMINIPVWMYLSSYIKFRCKLLTQTTMLNLLYFGRGVFGSDFGTTAFVFANRYFDNYIGTYKKLFERKVEVEPLEIKEQKFFSPEGVYTNQQENFWKISGNPYAYNMTTQMRKTFENGEIIDNIALPRQGMATGNNDVFLRFWHEIQRHNFIYDCKSVEDFHATGKLYAPYNKGGAFRKWYGNQDYVIKFDKKNYQILSTVGNHLPSRQYYFHPSLTWSKVTMGGFSMRYMPQGFVFDVSGCSLFADKNLIYNLLGFLNSKIAAVYFGFLSPTVNYEVGNIKAMPFIRGRKELIEQLVRVNIDISKNEWDSFETSWNFKVHPLVELKEGAGYCTDMSKRNYTIKSVFEHWEISCNNRFTQLKTNEEELNRIFIDIYGLQDELSPEVEDKDVTVRRADLGGEIRSLISYAVGCMFGRYSLDSEGLAFAGGKWNASKYNKFLPDKDNILPITDEEYLEDDIVDLFIAFVKKVYGGETLEENLDFIAKALGNRGNTSREIIRNYFVRDFFKDHCKVYQKRPIYWLFDSGKADGFKALIYMHRYDENTIGNIRVDYLHKMQRIYEREIARMQETIANNINSREVAAAEKRKDKLTKQLKETKDYDEKIAHLALSRIAIDLDDGVKANYEKVQTGTDGKKLEVLAKI